MDGNVYSWPIAKEGRIDIISANNRASTVYGLEIDCPNLMFRKSKKKDGPVSGSGKSNTVEYYNVILSYGDGYLRAPPWNFDSIDTNISTSTSDIPTLVIPPDNNDFHINCVCLSTDRQFLYAGTNFGTLRIYSWPPIVNKEFPNGFFVEIQAHDSPVVAVKQSIDSNTIITCGEDCAIFIFDFNRSLFPKPIDIEGKIMTPLGKTRNHNKNDNNNMVHETTLEVQDKNSRSELILMTTDDLKSHIKESVDLQKNLEEMQSLKEYEGHKLILEYEEQIKKIHENYKKDIEEEKKRYYELKMDMERRNASLLEQIELSKNEQIKARNDLENRYEHVLAEQMDRFDGLSEQITRVKQQSTITLKTEKQDFERQLIQLQDESNTKIKQLTNDLARITSDRMSDNMLFKETIMKRETEYETKIKNMIRTNETEKNSLTEENSNLRIALNK